MFDFRGRLYVDSIISYQSSKIFRHLYGYKITYDKNNFDNQSLVENLSDYITIIINNTSFAQDYPNININEYKKEIF